MKLLIVSLLLVMDLYTNASAGDLEW